MRLNARHLRVPKQVAAIIAARAREEEEEEEEELILLAIEDITERKRSEEALRKTKDELEERVAGRTSDLMSAYQKLQHEIEERRQAEQEVQDFAERLQTLAFQIMNAEESERRRISVILHDELGQDLIYLKYRLIKKSQKNNKLSINLYFFVHIKIQ